MNSDPRSSSRGKWLAALAALVVLLGVAAVLVMRARRGEIMPPAPAPADSTGALEPGESDAFESSEPPGPPAGRSDSLLNSIAPSLSTWLAMWRQAIPGMRLDSLYAGGAVPAFEARGVRREPLTGDAPWTVGDDNDEDITPEVLTVRSPDRRYELLIDRYQMIVGGGGDQLEIGGDVDSAPVLTDRRDRVSIGFAFCGSECGYHWAAWLDSKRFVLAGWSRNFDSLDTYHGTLSLYSLADSTETRWRTRSVGEREFARYSGAWEVWLRARYRAFKSSRAALPPRSNPFARSALAMRTR
jgi:hypothetical protein